MNRRSQKKKDLKEAINKIALNPLPIPLVRFSNDQQPAWPTNQPKYHVHFKGRIDFNKKCVFVDDVCSIYMLTTMGSFGKIIKTQDEQPSHIILDLYEAFFLSYALGCLILIGHHDDDNLDINKLPNLSELWLEFSKCYNSKDDPTKFATTYAVYHYFRSRGWVVKSGSQFGTTFTLYKEGPAYFHALYAVQVFSVFRGEDAQLTTTSPLYNWQSLLSVHRVIQSASKELLIAHVILPKIGTFPSGLSSPKCIQQFKVKTQLLSHWLPNTHL